ncbi:hypothetical protein JVU11DRAFT_8925 [Chiua virens]|nr:hypothetical protein JVU11DRAFT_8925 [Chiua virens]
MPQNMARGYNDGYNHDFTDEDARRLVSIASSPELSPHICRWVEDSARCNVSVQGLYLPSHLRDHHGIYGTTYRSVGYLCRWDGCADSSTFSKDGMLRHVQERHLQWRWNCPNCGAVYMGRPARDAHYILCDGLAIRNT